MFVHAARRLAFAGIAWPFSLLLTRRLRTDDDFNGRTTASEKSPQYTILALSAHRFRGDLELLEATGQFRVIRLPSLWQTGILGLFWEDKVEKAITLKWDYLKDDIPEWIKRRRSASRRFLGRLLGSLCASLKIDAVITATIYYPQDFDWAYAAEMNGRPYIAMHKENLVSGEGQRKFWRFAVGEIGKFFGSVVLVHTNIMQKLFIDAGFVKPDQVRALGVMRMDKYVAKVATRGGQRRKDKRPLAVFFSFERAPQLTGVFKHFPDDLDEGMPEFFRQAHICFGRLAQLRPEVDFVIKPKYGGIWEDEIINALAKDGIEIDKLPNLKIVPQTDVHRLIFDADVICAYGSTTLLESGITGSPVIMPCFAEAAGDEFREYVQFHGRDDLFDIATSVDDMSQKISHYLENPSATPARLKACRTEFEKYVSPLSGGACETYAKAIIDTIEMHTETARAPSIRQHQLESR